MGSQSFSQFIRKVRFQSRMKLRDKGLAQGRKHEGKKFHKIFRFIDDFHKELLDIAFGRTDPKKDRKMPTIDYDCLRPSDLSTLSAMVRIEFQVSLQKAIGTPEEHSATTGPRPLDVFLMRRSMNGRKVCLAALLPVVSGGKSDLLWNDADGNFWPLQPPSHVRRVACLAGPARILKSLSVEVPTGLQNSAMRRQDIFDVESNEDDNVVADPALTMGMNESQKRAVAIVSGQRFRKGFFVIQGPPGCGKTTTMVGMICAIGRGMIVAAPSNAAVANIALKLHAKKRYKLMEICVYGRNCDKSAYFLSPIHRGTHFQAFSKKIAILKDNDEKQRLQRDFAQWLHLDPDICTLEEMTRLCPYIDMDSPGGRSRLKAIVSTASVVACSLNTAGSSVLQKAIRNKGFHTFLLDEAGQCPEAEFYIATTFSGVERIIVVGDPKQLPATVIDTDNKQAGYGESWMGRVLSLYPSKVHLLNTQYRMDPAILEFPNACFYSKSIMSGDNVIGRSPFVEYPFRFVDTLKRGYEEKGNDSFKNTYEVNVIKAMLQSDEDIIRIRQNDANARVIIITPYRAQAELMRTMFASMIGLGDVDISTVDSFQGQEGEIVILSTVRTKSVGFVDDPQRLNVALTRAKRVIRVVGDLSFFLSQGRASTLWKLANHAKECFVMPADDLPTPTRLKDSDDQSQLNDSTKKRRNRRRKGAMGTAIVTAPGHTISSPTLPKEDNDQSQSNDGIDPKGNAKDKTRNGRRRKKNVLQTDADSPPTVGNDKSQLTNETRKEKKIRWLKENRMRQTIKKKTLSLDSHKERL